MTTGHESLTVSRMIAATPERIFEAWTNPEAIVQWWGAGGIVCPEAEMDLTFGGNYRIANRTPDGQTMWITGTFSVVEPPTTLAYTWAMEPTGPDTEYSTVRVAFEAQADGTLVTVRHSRIASPEAHETNLVGWQGCLDGLIRLVAPG
jgi:uncharacterized protein YndB with AHSA1/START domain